MCKKSAKNLGINVIAMVVLAGFAYGEIHTDFMAGMQRNGYASVNINGLYPSSYGKAGSAFWWKKQNVADGFTTEFPFTIGRSGSADGSYSTGFAFVIQNSSISALGSSSYGLGYNGIQDALVVEFDHLKTSPAPFSLNHLAVQCGNTGTVSSDHNLALAFSSFVQDMQGSHLARISYSGNRLQVWVDPTTWMDPWIDINVNIGDSLNLTDGTAWVGFTGASGTGYTVIKEWDFTAVPEPATMSLLGLGSMVFLKRRK